MNNKILFCASVDYHFKAFHLPYMKWFKEQGWEVDVAAAGEIDLPYVDHKFNIPIERSPFHLSNIVAYQQLKAIINQNNYAIIHGHTPLGGLLARVAARQARKRGTKLIYTAHGFHFCKGVSWLNWLMYYPVERYLSRLTDSLITINQEDYHLAIQHRFSAKDITYIAGVGVDIERFKPVDDHVKKQLKIAAGFKTDDVLLCNIGEFNKNKNQQFLLHAMVHIMKASSDVQLIFAGEGALKESCQQLANQLGISNRVHFWGFRSDIDAMMPMCDMVVAASKREGLPVSVMEGMACELPIVAVDNRGHRDLIQDGFNGWLVTEWDAEAFAEKVKTLIGKDLGIRFGKNGRKLITGKYSINQILQEKSLLYKKHMGKGDVTWKVP